MARRNRAEVVIANEVGVYQCVHRVVRRAFLCEVDPLSGNSYDQRRTWIRDRVESLASILDRLRVSAESWLKTVARFGRQFHRAAGLSEHLKVEARRLGVNRLHGLRWSQVAFAHSPCLDKRRASIIGPRADCLAEWVDPFCSFSAPVSGWPSLSLPQRPSLNVQSPSSRSG